MTWHPGRDEKTAQELSVRFVPEAGGTRVAVVHTGWERVGPDFRARMAATSPGGPRARPVRARPRGRS